MKRTTVRPSLFPHPLFLRAYLFVFLCLWTLPALWAQSGSSKPTTDESINRIQVECLRAWPPDLLFDMTGRESVPPETLEQAEAHKDLFIDSIRTNQGAYFPSDLEDLKEAFEQYVQPGKRFLDLGSGDGRAVFMAAAMGAEAVGYESDTRLYAASLQARGALRGTFPSNRARLVEGDYFNVSWSDYDVVFYRDSGSDDALRLRQKIFSELGPDAVFLVASPQIPFPGLSLETTYEAAAAYRQPKSIETDASVVSSVEEEVEGLHRFLQDWFNGRVEQTDANLSRFADALVPGFQILSADGSATQRGAAIHAVNGAYGMWKGQKGGKILIENLALRFRTSHSAVVTYDERHVVGETSLGFRSTAVLQMRRGSPSGVEWVHLHQTALP